MDKFACRFACLALIVVAVHSATMDHASNFTCSSSFTEPTKNHQKVHKSVLEVRSTVFKKLFSGRFPVLNWCKVAKLREGKYLMCTTGSIALNEFIRAIYLGVYELKFSSSEESVSQLLELAYIYQVHDLKKLIVDDILASITKENSQKIVDLASRYKFGWELCAVMCE